MTAGEIAAWLNQQAPFETAESFDNVGLLIGTASAEVTSVMFGMDVTEALLREAAEKGANTVITHHPFLFHPLKRIDTASPQGRCLTAILSGGIQVLAAHTNWDQAAGGISDELASVLGLAEVTPCDRYLRIGTLPQPLSEEAFAGLVRDRLNVDCHIYSPGGKTVSRVAVAGGAYGDAAFFAADFGADALVVGEVKHHEILEGTSRGLVICCAEHYATEIPGLRALYRRFVNEPAFEGIRERSFLHSSPPFRGALRLPEGGHYGTD